jgi:hypothetical protein
LSRPRNWGRSEVLAAFVTNDNLVDLLGAILTLVALRSYLRLTRWRMAVVDGVVGLLLLTKFSPLYMALVLVVLTSRPRAWFSRAPRTPSILCEWGGVLFAIQANVLSVHWS